TPMNAIIGMTELLFDGELTERQREFASTIRGSGLHLLALINDILDFSKIEAGKLTLDHVPFDLRRCVEDALNLVALPAADKRLAERMGGRTGVDSEVGRGSTFYFSAIAEAQDSPAPAVDTSSLRGRRVLLVDDSESILRVLSRAAASFDMTAQAFTSAGQAL